jgi:hypothetical protein
MRGKGQKRQRREQETGKRTAVKKKRQDEIVEERLPMFDKEGEQCAGSGKVIDFETILQAEMNVQTQSMLKDTNFSGISDVPERMRCGGDDISGHVPAALREKICKNEFVKFFTVIEGRC